MTQEAHALPPREVPELHCEDFQIRNLWQAVIEQAALDLRGAVGHRSKIEREDGVARAVETEKWVRGEPCFPGDATDYFAEVCDLAGVEAAPVREKILRSLQFPSVKRSDVGGLIVEPKYCEVCGKTVLRPRGSKQVTCASCGAREASRVATQPLSSAVALAFRYLESDPDARTGQPYVPGDLLRMTCLAANVPNQAEAQRRWPWLKETVDPPCDCQHLETPNALIVLQHLYETHVRARQDWTAEQLIAWVQEHEHAALAPEQPEQPQPQDDAQVSDSPVPEFAAAIYASGKAGAMEQDHAGASQ